MRPVQYDWQCYPKHEGQTRDIFERDHLFEAMVRELRAGFEFAQSENLGFSTFSGAFRGHCVGIVTRGPELLGVGYPTIWKHKALGDNGWRSLDRDGLQKACPHYAAQVLMYQHYLGMVEHPAIFTAATAITVNDCICSCHSTPWRPAPGSTAPRQSSGPRAPASCRLAKTPSIRPARSATCSTRRKSTKGGGRRTIKGKPLKKLSAVIMDGKVSQQRYRVCLWNQRFVEINSGIPMWYRHLPNFAHLGVETQWADKAILYITPVLLGLFPIATLWAYDLSKSRKLKPKTMVSKSGQNFQRRHRG
jgi:hypothetical protein